MMIIRMYITLMPVILAGIMNMIFTKTALYINNKTPIDRGKLLKDGKRLFGDNKTWIGFWGMIIFSIIAQLAWGMACRNIDLLCGKNELYRIKENNWQFNILIGLLFGAAYVLCELPNSFIKRRLDIQPGKTDKALKGFCFFIIDQIDSLIGITLILACFTPMTAVVFCMYLLLGAATHIGINLALYKLHIRRNL